MWSGHSCPLPLTLVLFFSRWAENHWGLIALTCRIVLDNAKSKAAGQECPLHTKVEILAAHTPSLPRETQVGLRVARLRPLPAFL